MGNSPWLRTPWHKASFTFILDSKNVLAIYFISIINIVDIFELCSYECNSFLSKQPKMNIFLYVFAWATLCSFITRSFTIVAFIHEVWIYLQLIFASYVNLPGGERNLILINLPKTPKASEMITDSTSMPSLQLFCSIPSFIETCKISTSQRMQWIQVGMNSIEICSRRRKLKNRRTVFFQWLWQTKLLSAEKKAVSIFQDMISFLALCNQKAGNCQDKCFLVSDAMDFFLNQYCNSRMWAIRRVKNIMSHFVRSI